MDKKEVIAIVTKYSELIRDMIHVQKVILFGSYSKDTARNHSDIDVAVVVDKIDSSILEMEFLLHKLTRNVDLRIEPVLFEEGNDPTGFLEEISKNGILVFSHS